jgi:CheY-like chemotaxis protein
MKKRILVAEDSRDLADVMRSALQFYGYQVFMAHDGVEAVENAIRLLPDLIVMDILMPRMSGLEATRQLRQHPDTETIPILAASALTTSEAREKCFASGCDDHLPKPFSGKELADAVGRLLQGASRKPHEYAQEQSLTAVH